MTAWALAVKTQILQRLAAARCGVLLKSCIPHFVLGWSEPSRKSNPVQASVPYY